VSFIRPEVRAALWRWREALAGLGLALFGGWVAMRGLGIVAVIGVLVMVLGIALAAAGWQRARFRRGTIGAGVVQVTEGQVAYFGPVTGGVRATGMIGRIVLNPLPRSGPVWELHAAGEEPLLIPADATGAEALFDVFETLPGLSMETVLAALEDPGRVPQVLWTRPHARLH